ncbi:MAG TPA: hypothetical protein VIF15_01455 [Polyangiaceae bacterium]|jgi:uncharacterized protein (DUF779 family)
MLEFIRTHWRKVSTGVLALALLGAGGVKLHSVLSGGCCQPGSPCCHPGSPCCAHGQAAPKP